MKITNRYDSSKIIYEAEANSIKELVERAVKEKISLEGANLGGTNLWGVNLCGANLGKWERDPKTGYAKRKVCGKCYIK